MPGSAIVGKNAVVGNSTELKNVVLFDNVQTPHYNYVGDSILGYKAHMGAGSITSNVKSDKTLVVIKNGDELDRDRPQKGRGHPRRLRCRSAATAYSIPERCSAAEPACIPPPACAALFPEDGIYKAKDDIVIQQSKKNLRTKSRRF